MLISAGLKHIDEFISFLVDPRCIKHPGPTTV